MTNTETRWRSKCGRFAVRLVHLNAGWRYWAFDRNTGEDVEVGLREDGYESMAAARRAVAKLAKATVKEAA
jgi:hypothetical protein